jgi:hypothetical protein
MELKIHGSPAEFPLPGDFVRLCIDYFDGMWYNTKSYYFIEGVTQ